MLDLDNHRFPVALMWALPEVMQEGGAVIAEIHVSVLSVRPSLQQPNAVHSRSFFVRTLTGPLLHYPRILSRGIDDLLGCKGASRNARGLFHHPCTPVPPPPTPHPLYCSPFVTVWATTTSPPHYCCPPVCRTCINHSHTRRLKGSERDLYRRERSCRGHHTAAAFRRGGLP